MIFFIPPATSPIILATFQALLDGAKHAAGEMTRLAGERDIFRADLNAANGRIDALEKQISRRALQEQQQEQVDLEKENDKIAKEKEAMSVHIKEMQRQLGVEKAAMTNC